MKQYLMDVQGFPERDILMLLDDGRTRGPTRRNIEDACAKVCQASQDGDTVWVYYSGHGGQVRRNKSRHVGKEHSSLLFPADFCKSGQISEDDGKPCFRDLSLILYFYMIFKSEDKFPSWMLDGRRCIFN